MNAKDLLTYSHAYILANPVCKKHRQNIANRVGKFVSWACDRPMDATTVNEFLLSLESTSLSPHTINGYRANIMAIWSYALGTRVPYKIRRVRPPQKPIEGWSIAEIRQLCRTAKTYRRILPNGVPERLFWLTAIHAGFSTALRYGDLASLEVNQVDASRRCQVVQSKTGKLVTVRFSEHAWKLIQRHGRKRILPSPYTQEWFCVRFSGLVERSGVRPGSFRWLRRSAGSYVDRESDRGPELLGNTRAVFNSNYKVGEIVERDPPEPPSLKAS